MNERETARERGRKRERERKKERKKKRKREKGERETEREREREKGRKKREREKERKRERDFVICPTPSPHGDFFHGVKRVLIWNFPSPSLVVEPEFSVIPRISFLGGDLNLFLDLLTWWHDVQSQFTYSAAFQSKLLSSLQLKNRKSPSGV